MSKLHQLPLIYAIKIFEFYWQKTDCGYPAKVHYQSNLKLLSDIGHYWARPVNLIFCKFHLSKKKNL